MIPMPAHSSPVAAPAERCSLRGFAPATFFGLLLLGLLVGCSGGGDSGGSPPGGSGNIISGTAATGDPIALGTITIKDSLGEPRSTVTDQNGNYSFNVSGSTAPFILKAVPKAAGSVPLYSFADKSGTTNITPLTDLVLYEALGRSDIGTVFDSGNLSKLPVSSVNAAETMVRSNFPTQLTANGLSTATDLFRTPFIANGTGQDAVIQNTLVTKLSTGGLYINDSGNLCVPYERSVKAVTFAIDGINPASIGRLFGLDPQSAVRSATYLKPALDKACVSRNIVDVRWTGDLAGPDTQLGVASLKKALRDANKDEPINIVSHSWGSMIAYITLRELADPIEEKVGDKLIKVNTLITMGSPIQYLAEDPNSPAPSSLTQRTDSLGTTKDVFSNMQGFVPVRFTFPNPIQQPNNVISWVNYQNPCDPIATKITVLGLNSRAVDRFDRYTPDECPFLLFVPEHNVYFDAGVAVPVAPTLVAIKDVISRAQASSSPVPPVVQAPATVALPTPDAFTVTAGAPYCDTRIPVEPAVKLTWSVSTNASFYRVFRDGKATGVQLGSSQLDFVNELGLIAGQSYSYIIKATNASGETWSSPAR